MTKTAVYLDSKNHYEILDGLRGVAAIMVVIFHIFETFNGGSRFAQIINHGYLAVDFFFLLSGFVVAYAYDDRWNKMTQWDFYKRRLIRLQPMVIMGSIVGAVFFYFQGGNLFSIINHTPVWKMLLVMLVGFTMIPIPPSLDIRGWAEMYPLNGPAWSLLFEYIANILYALVIRKFSKKALWIFVILAGVLMIHYLLFFPEGDMIGGWAIDKLNIRIGFTRLLFPFFAGMLLCRIGKKIHLKNAFLFCSLLLIVIFSLPRFGDATQLWKNGLYECICIIILFPLIVAIGAGGKLETKRAENICKFLGQISYPIYITHYALIYTYTAWVVDNKISLSKGWPYGLIVLFGSIAIAWACLKWYDEPIREWLRKKYLVKRTL